MGDCAELYVEPEAEWVGEWAGCDCMWSEPKPFPEDMVEGGVRSGSREGWKPWEVVL